MQRLHVAAGHLCAVVAEDDTAQDVHGGVGAHELVAARPVQPPGDGRAHGRQVAGEEVDRATVDLLDRGHIPDAAAGSQRAYVTGLSAAAGVEGSACQQHAALDLLGHHGVELLSVGVGLI